LVELLSRAEACYSLGVLSSSHLIQTALHRGHGGSFADYLLGVKPQPRLELQGQSQKLPRLFLPAGLGELTRVLCDTWVNR